VREIHGRKETIDLLLLWKVDHLHKMGNEKSL
jgi:hypothetical protein